MCLIVASVALCGCSKKKYEQQCESAVAALGVGQKNFDSHPVTEIDRRAQLDRAAKALANWETTKEKVTLADIRGPADGLAAALADRKKILESAKFQPAPEPARSDDPQQKLMREATEQVLGSGSPDLVRATRIALKHNGDACRKQFGALMRVCASKAR